MVAGPYLKELGWHIAPVLPNDSPVPPADFTIDGPGKYIQTKAKSAGIWSKQTGSITPVIADGLVNGFYQDYGGSRIYLKMLRGLDLSGAETTPRYSPVFIVLLL